MKNQAFMISFRIGIVVIVLLFYLLASLRDGFQWGGNDFFLMVKVPALLSFLWGCMIPLTPSPAKKLFKILLLVSLLATIIPGFYILLIYLNSFPNP